MNGPDTEVSPTPGEQLIEKFVTVASLNHHGEECSVETESLMGFASSLRRNKVIVTALAEEGINPLPISVLGREHNPVRIASAGGETGTHLGMTDRVVGRIVMADPKGGTLTLRPSFWRGLFHNAYRVQVLDGERPQVSIHII